MYIDKFSDVDDLSFADDAPEVTRNKRHKTRTTELKKNDKRELKMRPVHKEKYRNWLFEDE